LNRLVAAAQQTDGQEEHFVDEFRFGLGRNDFDDEFHNAAFS